MHSSRLLQVARYGVATGAKRCKVSRIAAKQKLVQEPAKTFSADDIVMEAARSERLRPKPSNWNQLIFGFEFADHMLSIPWTSEHGWSSPRIHMMETIQIHPASKCLHYATQLFEGMKAYRGVDNKVRLFRPELNAQRMISTAERSCLPSFSPDELIACITELVLHDIDWVPPSSLSSLYIRPTFIGTDPHLGVSVSQEALLYVITGPVGPYFPSGYKPVTLYANPRYVRAWTGGVGAYKMGSNYGPTVHIQQRAAQLKCQQVLWLFGEEQLITECGTMNVFMHIVENDGTSKLITPSLHPDGLILPGVTRRSLIELALEYEGVTVEERAITMTELRERLKAGQLKEVFGCGTACLVCPVEKILYHDEDGGREIEELNIPTMAPQPAGQQSLMLRLAEHMRQIQYGIVARPEWTPIIWEP